MISRRKYRRPVLGLQLLIIMLVQPGDVWAQETGEQLFQSTCSACHSIGGGRLVGPDLAGVNERRSRVWLEAFIKSSQSLVESGDAEAIAVFEKFSGMIMPDAPFSDAQITQVLDFIEAQGSNLPTLADESDVGERAPSVPLSMEHVRKGQELFQGTTRFQNGGSSCNACHDVKNDAVIGGGILAAELTTVFSRMGGTGVGAILGQAPFPVMQAAYKDNALTDDEITYLVTFLQDADEQHLFHQPRDYGIGLFASGTVGAGVLFLLFAFIWRGRKSGSVNQQIYDRQVKSVLDDSTH
jgi:mono/diheme cytochrome c family protein